MNQPKIAPTMPNAPIPQTPPAPATSPVNPDPKAHPIHPAIPSQPIHESGGASDPINPITETDDFKTR